MCVSGLREMENRMLLGAINTVDFFESLNGEPVLHRPERLWSIRRVLLSADAQKFIINRISNEGTPARVTSGDMLSLSCG